MVKKLLVACVGAAALLAAGVAMAGVPCASTSTVDVSVLHKTDGTYCPGPTDGAFCPVAGDQDTVHIDVVIQDCYGNVLAGRSVSVNVPTGFRVDDLPAPVDTDGLGEASFTFSYCGGCGFAQYGVTVDGVSLQGNLIYQASFDNFPEGAPDGVVGLSDFAKFSVDLWASEDPGPLDPCGDYDCNGAVGLGDFAKFSSHFGIH